MSSVIKKRIHCVGAGGAGVLPLALCLRQKGHEVSAEDDAMNNGQREQLEAAGIRIGALDASSEGTLVRSSAIGASHPTVGIARAAGWNVMRRGECLAEIAKEKKLIAVVGSHGKTTTTGFLIDLCEGIGEAVSYLLGANFRDGTSPGRWNEHAWLVAEVDESDRTIDLFEPEITVWLNADHDHHSQYATREDYLSVFENLVRRTKGVSLVSVDQGLKEVGEANVRTVGDEGDWSWKRLSNGDLRVEGKGSAFSGAINRAGEFNDSNFAFSVAAIESAFGTLPPLDRVELRSIDRRQSCRYLSPDIRVMDDYAHHPEEIRSLLASLGKGRGSRRVVIFQAHRYTRTARLKRELADSLSGVDRVYLLDVYAASETACEGGGLEDLAAEFKGSEKAVWGFESDEALFRQLDAEGEQGPVDYLFLGAGRTDGLAKAYAARLACKDKRWGAAHLKFAEAGSFESVFVAEEPMARKTTLRVGGAAERYCEPRSLSELTALLKGCAASGIPVQILGRGSNLIVPDSGVGGLVIRLQDPYWRRYERLENRLLKVGAGMRIKELCGLACRLEMAGFEFLEGIPGSVGGALRMNAGAMGGWMFDVVERVTFVTLAGEIFERSAADMDVGYRYCAELREAIAVEAVLKANEEPVEQGKIRSAIDVYQGKRKESQPREPSAGCIFKNPEGDSAGRLIDVLGLKGTAIGGARFSEVHGNFIVNTGGASSQDVIDLIKLARRVAMKEKQVDLEPEALLYGGSWKEVLS